MISLDSENAIKPVWFPITRIFVHVGLTSAKYANYHTYTKINIIYQSSDNCHAYWYDEIILYNWCTLHKHLITKISVMLISGVMPWNRELVLICALSSKYSLFEAHYKMHQSRYFEEWLIWRKDVSWAELLEYFSTFRLLFVMHKIELKV